MSMQNMDLKKCIRTVPNWPKEGVMFRDITTLLQNPLAFREVISNFAERYKNKVDVIAGIEARGFIFGSALAHTLGVSFVPIRKKGKLPSKVIREEYALEYGTDTIEIHSDAIKKGDRVLIIDDLIATGGTLLAAARLVEILGGKIVEIAAVIDLPDLGGRKKLELKGYQIFSIMDFEGE
jgi:adenine phosphoribosyltransferase